MSISAEVRSMRERIGLSQDGFAALVGVCSATVFFWEAGTRRPSPLAREKLLYVKRTAEKIRDKDSLDGPTEAGARRIT